MIDIDEFERQQAALEPSQIAHALNDEIRTLNVARTIVAALGKQLPKIIDVWANGTEHCPNCDHDITQISFDDVYCSRCGQKLKKGE